MTGMAMSRKVLALTWRVFERVSSSLIQPAESICQNGGPCRDESEFQMIGCRGSMRMAGLRHGLRTGCR